jgi:hypothetical protein
MFGYFAQVRQKPFDLKEAVLQAGRLEGPPRILFGESKKCQCVVGANAARVLFPMGGERDVPFCSSFPLQGTGRS